MLQRTVVSYLLSSEDLEIISYLSVQTGSLIGSYPATFNVVTKYGTWSLEAKRQSYRSSGHLVEVGHGQPFNLKSGGATIVAPADLSTLMRTIYPSGKEHDEIAFEIASAYIKATGQTWIPA